MRLKSEVPKIDYALFEVVLIFTKAFILGGDFSILVLRPKIITELHSEGNLVDAIVFELLIGESTSLINVYLRDLMLCHDMLAIIVHKIQSRMIRCRSDVGVPKTGHGRESGSEAPI